MTTHVPAPRPLPASVPDDFDAAFAAMRDRREILVFQRITIERLSGAMLRDEEDRKGDYRSLLDLMNGMNLRDSARDPARVRLDEEIERVNVQLARSADDAGDNDAHRALISQFHDSWRFWTETLAKFGRYAKGGARADPAAVKAIAMACLSKMIARARDGVPRMGAEISVDEAAACVRRVRRAADRPAHAADGDVYDSATPSRRRRTGRVRGDAVRQRAPELPEERGERARNRPRAAGAQADPAPGAFGAPYNEDSIHMASGDYNRGRGRRRIDDGSSSGSSSSRGGGGGLGASLDGDEEAARDTAAGL